jgi:hypothetical protein
MGVRGPASNDGFGLFSTEFGRLSHLRFTPDSDGRADIPVRRLRVRTSHYKTIWAINNRREREDTIPLSPICSAQGACFKPRIIP